MSLSAFLFSLLLISLTTGRPTVSSEEDLGEEIVLPTNHPTPPGYNIARHMLEVDHLEKMTERQELEAKFEAADEKTASKYWVYWLILSRILG